jgi:ComF family protein
MTNSSKPYLDALADLFYPEYCVGCGKRSSDVLCRGCVEALPEVGVPVCGRCGAPTAFEVYGCNECRNRELGFEGARAPLRYEGVGKEIVHTLKYAGYRRVVEKVAAPLMAGAADGKRFDAVVAVPLHRSRLAKRGFNQAELLARGAAGEIGAPFVDALRATRKTRDQVELSAAGRRENVRGAFAVKGPVPGKVLLVDDVYTTGATLSECADALRDAGAREVHALTLCRTV